MEQLNSLKIDHLEKQKDTLHNTKGVGLETRDSGDGLWMYLAQEYCSGGFRDNCVQPSSVSLP
jgi:hypothetical protein